MAGQEIQEGRPEHRPTHEGTHILHPGSDTPVTDGLSKNWPNVKLNHEQETMAKTLADMYGQALKGKDPGKLLGFVEATMQGDLRKLAELADPKNEQAAHAFGTMMKDLGYDVVLGKADGSRPYNSVDIVSQKAAGEVGGQGIELRQMAGTNSYRAYSTQNEDGSITYPRDANVLHKLRNALASRVRNSQDKD